MLRAPSFLILLATVGLLGTWATACGDTASSSATGDSGGTDGSPDPASSDHDDATADANVTSDGGDGAPDGEAASPCGPCNAPPSACYAKVGTCEKATGACSYVPVTGASCNDGNACTAGDVCNAKAACSGTAITCDAAPASQCIASNKLLTFDTVGACTGGTCVYSQHTITCAAACVGNACTTDPCVGIACSTPPNGCFKAAGSCSKGSCSYAYDDGATCDDHDLCTVQDSCGSGVCKGVPKACDTPPASTCVNATTLKAYDPIGACSAGTCGYTQRAVNCTNGCSNGTCTPSGWTTQSSNTIVDLFGVWGSSASSVWAVGAQGTALYYNGLNWQVRATGELGTMRSVHGTGPDNVYVTTVDVANGRNGVLHYDGANFGSLIALPANIYPFCVFATGANNALLAAGELAGKSLNLYAVSGTQVTFLASALGDSSICKMQSLGAGKTLIAATTFFTWDGAALTNEGKRDARAAYAAAPGSIYYGSVSNVMRWNGTASPPSLLNTGYTGDVVDIAGTSASRVFALGANTSMGAITSAVLTFDGVGWTQDALTVAGGSPWMHAIWAAPTGEVVAVGGHGRIFKGP